MLINNAGVNGPYGDPSDLSAADILTVLDINVVGVVRTTTAFLPLLRIRARAPRWRTRRPRRCPP